jgi:hypothetical protein
MKFEAQYPDLKIEVVTFAKEELVLEPKIQLTPKLILEIIRKWRGLESNQTDDFTPFEITAVELTDIYDRTSDWFLENFDLGTIQEIMRHVAETMGNFKKKSTP